MDEFLILLQAKLDEAKSRETVTEDIDTLQGKLDKLKLQATIDPNTAQTLAKEIEKVINQKIVISNIVIDTEQSVKSAQQAGKNIGNAINQSVSSSLKNIKNDITNTIKSIPRLDATNIIEEMNLNRASVGKDVVSQVKLMISEINNLGVEVVKTGSDGSWEKLISKGQELGKILDTFGKTRNYPGIEEIKKIADYFEGKTISVGYKSSALSGTDFTASQLSKDLKDLGVKFSATKQEAVELDTIWEEMCNTTGRMDLIKISNAQDQIQTVINELLKAQSILHGEKGLVAVQNAYGVVSEYFDSVEKSRKVVANLENEMSTLTQKEVESSASATATIIQNEGKKQQAYRETANIHKTLSSEESIVKSGAAITTFEGTNNAAKEAQQYFRNLLKDEQAVIATTEKFGENNNLTSFIVNVKRASGEVESLRYTIASLKDEKGNIGDTFYKLSGSSIGDTGAIKQIKAIENTFANFTQKIEQFKSTNSGKLSGLTRPLSDFESKLIGLKNGTNTIDEVSNSFKLLQAESSKIEAPLKRQLSTFDSYKNAVDKGKESISGYRAELKGLTNAPKELSQELTKASKLLLQINKTEATEGTTANWSNQAREFVDLLTNIGNKINVIKKEQTNSASTQFFNTKDLDAQGKIYIQKINNTIEKTKSEIESKLRNAGYMDIEIKGIEEANGKIKSLTVNATDATGAFKQLNFERAKVQNNGKAQAGLIQTDDVKVIGNISSAIQTVQDNLSSLRAKWKEQGILVGDFKSKVEQLESSISTVGSKGELENLKSQIQTLKSEASTIADINKIQLSIGDKGDITTQIKTLSDSFSKLGLSADEAKAKINGVDHELAELKALLNNGASNSAITSQFKKLQSALRETQNDLKATRSEYSMLASNQQRLAKANVIEAWNLKNRNATQDVRNANESYITSLRDLDTEMSKLKFNEISDGFSRIKNSMTALGKISTAVKGQLAQVATSLVSLMSLSRVAMQAVNWVTRMPSTVTALDTALVDLRKTANMSTQKLEDFYYASNDVAKQMGVTTEEILNQAAAWSRLGFSTAEQATQMAKLSSQFALISPGLSIDDATSGLVSVMKAYDISVSDVLDGIESKINIIGNNLALSNANIVKMLQDSVSAMAEGRNSLEETIALEAAAYEITQNESVGKIMPTNTVMCY